jgi:hypothetical protein
MFKYLSTDSRVLSARLDYAVKMSDMFPAERYRTDSQNFIVHNGGPSEVIRRTAGSCHRVFQKSIGSEMPARPFFYLGYVPMV